MRDLRARVCACVFSERTGNVTDEWLEEKHRCSPLVLVVAGVFFFFFSRRKSQMAVSKKEAESFPPQKAFVISGISFFG